MERITRRELQRGGKGTNPVGDKPKAKSDTTTPLSSHATWVNARFPPKMKMINESLNDKMDKLIDVISANSNAILQLVNHIKVPSKETNGTLLY